MTSTDPAAPTWRGTLAAMDAASTDPGVLAVVESARFLLLHGHLMPPGERAAMRESLAEAAAADLPGLLSAWHTTAALCAQIGPEAHSGPQSPCGGPPLTGGGERVVSPLVPSTDALPAVETPHRQVPAQSEASPAIGSPPFERIPVPRPLEETEPAQLPRRFASLTPAQLALAQELNRRAEKLWTDADGELGLAEAVTIAAVQMGHYGHGGDAG